MIKKQSKRTPRLESLENRRLLAGDTAAALQPMAGDCNRDGTVEFGDFITLANNFGETEATWEDGDFDGDRNVGFADFNLMSQNFGKSDPVERAERGSDDDLDDDLNDDLNDDSADDLTDVDHDEGHRDDLVDDSLDDDGEGDGASQHDADDLGETDEVDELDEVDDDDSDDDLLDDSSDDDGYGDGASQDDADDLDEADEVDELDEVDDDDLDDDLLDDSSDDDGYGDGASQDDDGELDDYHGEAQETELEASLVGPNVRGEAEFEVEDGETEFEVELYGATPNATYAVAVDNVFAGNLTTNSQGYGELEFSTDPDDDEVPFPDDFPIVQVGSSITVGEMVGEFILDD